MLEEMFPGARRIVISPGSPPPAATEDLFPVFEEYQSIVPDAEDIPALLPHLSIMDHRFSTGSSTDSSNYAPLTPGALTEASEPSIYEEALDTFSSDSEQAPIASAPTPPLSLPPIKHTNTIRSLNRDVFWNTTETKLWQDSLEPNTKPAKKTSKLRLLKWWNKSNT